MKKIFFLLLLFFLFLSCSTIEYSRIKNIFEDNTTDLNSIREFDLKYEQKILGIKIKGDKTIVEGFFLHPDQKSIFIPVSFPKIGILKTDDYGKTISASFFKLQGLEEFFGYSEEDKETEIKKDKQKILPKRVWTNFTYSPIDNNKIAISFGEYIFLSNDKGNKWIAKKIFYDRDKSNIIDIFITNREEIIAITENKIARSFNWGKNWKYEYIKIPEINFFKLRYISGFYDNSSDLLYASFINTDEKDSLLSYSSYQFLYKNKNILLKSGLFVSKDLGKTFTKTSLSIPLVLWKYNDKIYASSIYSFSLYNHNFSESFLNSSIVKTGKIDANISQLKEYIQYLENLTSEDFDIVSFKNNRILTIEEDGESYSIIEERDFSNIYNANKRLENLPYLIWDENWMDREKSNNFFYEYSPDRLFRIWTGMRNNSPNLYLKGNKIYYRISCNKEFLKVFFKYCIENTIRINKINPFLRKSTDIEFFDPSLDPTYGFPVNIEYSSDNGISWHKLVDSKHIRNIIDPLNNKRSGFYWYKNVEQKRIFRLQISFGFDQGVNYMVYPFSATLLENDIAIVINYFTISNSYKDIYLIPVKKDLE
ncbi:MAG TPA: hypothetical protein PLE45_10230 [Spirochaetota bacterium]|nr:hypothetical protein [Spirochaetota bacterium]HOL56574.1 hypothetical protein [Spirochaetota bacterium]